MVMPVRGWKKDKRDERDHLKAKAVYLLPPSVDLRLHLPAVRDQGNLGSCVGFGIAGNLTAISSQLGVYSEWFSPTWVYNGARLIAGDLPYDVGAYPRDACDFLLARGSLYEHFRPYKDILDKVSPLAWTFGEPTVLCSVEAAKWPLIEYIRCVDGIDGIKAALAEGRFVSIGAPWFSSWFNTDSQGRVPADYSSVAGGHEFLCYGYDDNLQALLCLNSWGESYGLDGRFLVPYSAVMAWKSNGGYDAHTFVASWSEPAPPPPPKKKSLTWLWILLGIAVAVTALVILL